MLIIPDVIVRKKFKKRRKLGEKSVRGYSGYGFELSAGKLEVSRWKLLLRDASGREKEFLMERGRKKERKKGEKVAKNMFSLLAEKWRPVRERKKGS